MNTEFFDVYGYQIFDGVVPLPLIEEIHTLLEIDAHASLRKAFAEIDCSEEASVLEKIDSIARALGDDGNRLNKGSKDALSGHISLATRLSPELRKIPSVPGVLEIVRKLLRTDTIFMHMPPTARFVLPGNLHAAVPPHQDAVYNQHMADFLVIWVPLVDIDDDCGGVVVYENTGSLPQQQLGPNSSAFWQEGVDVSRFTPVHCKLRRGDILALNKFVVHASMPNRSTRTRYSIDHRFFGSEDLSTKHYLDLKNQVVIAPQGK